MKIDEHTRIPMLEPYTVTHTVAALSETADYNHRLLNIPAAWARTRGEGVRIAVLDTGAPTHVDIKVAGSMDFSGSGSVYDRSGHGTHVAGIVCATADNGIGVKGIAPEASLYCGKVLGDDGSGSIDAIVRGIYWAVEDVKADVINMSLGCHARMSVPQSFRAACDYARHAGVVICAAAGNDSGAVNYPASFSSTISVAAIDFSEKTANFSCHGREIDFAAGGVDVFSTWLDNAYAKLSGTSMACPAISGVVALMISEKLKYDRRKMTPDEVYSALVGISKDIAAPGRDENTGNGIPIFASAGATVPKKAENTSFFRKIVAKIINFIKFW